MTAIKSESDLMEFFEQDRPAVLFRDWSEYAVISKQMVHHVERYSKMPPQKISFYCFGEKKEIVPLVDTLRLRGVPYYAFLGNDSLLSSKEADTC